MLALAHYREHLLCPCGCGWPKAISMDPMTEFNLEPAQAVRCHVRTNLLRAQEGAKDRPLSGGLLWSTQLRTSADVGD